MALAVLLGHRAVRAEELLVDEVRDARLLRAGPQLVGGNEPRDGGVHERDLGRRQVHVRSRLASGWRSGRGLRHMAGAVRVLLAGRLRGRQADGSHRDDRLQKATAT
jgi:hypothetical protein